MFSVDYVEVGKNHVTAYRRGTGVAPIVVTMFSNLLPWRTVNSGITYMVDSKTVMDREHEEGKAVREIIKAYRAELKEDTDEHVAEQIEKHGDFRSGNYI